jgi:hypothetical protein
MGMWENGCHTKARRGAPAKAGAQTREALLNSPLGLDPCLRRGTNCQILKIDALFVNVEGAHSSPAETPVDSFV